ncbi:MAG: LamG-like jellyroll fold domain-containing protein [Flavobacteriales bacterium]
MNKIISLLLFMAFGFSSCQKGKNQNCTSIIADKDVIAFFPFANGSFKDFSGEGHHLQAVGSPSSTVDRKGNVSCALNFDNLNGNVQHLFSSQSDFLNGLDEFSISVWYYAIDNGNAGGHEVFVCRGEGQRCPDKIGEWKLGLFDCHLAEFGHLNSVWEEHDSGIACEDFGLDQWKHVVATYRKFPYSIKLYVNGKLHESEWSKGNCSSEVSVEDIGDLFIGKNFSGILDDVIIYKKELESSEVKDLYEMEACCTL